MRYVVRARRHLAGRAAALLATTLAMACATTPSGRGGERTMRMDETSRDRQVQLAMGQDLEIVLGETRTTGYRWTVVSSGGPVCRLDRDEYEAPNSTPGAPGRHRWIFRAAQAGSGVIELAYARPFGAGEPARRYIVHVVAR